VESLGQVTELVTVRHPNSHITLKTLKQLINMAAELGSLQIGMAVFPRRSRNDIVRVQTVCELLQTIADTQDGDTEVEEGGIGVGSAVLVNGVRTAGEDNTLGLPSEVGELLGAGEHLGVDIDFSQATGDEVGASRAYVRHKFVIWLEI
jgi:hypothetical protein